MSIAEAPADSAITKLAQEARPHAPKKRFYRQGLCPGQAVQRDLTDPVLRATPTILVSGPSTQRFADTAL